MITITVIGTVDDEPVIGVADGVYFERTTSDTWVRAGMDNDGPGERTTWTIDGLLGFGLSDDQSLEFMSQVEANRATMAQSDETNVDVDVDVEASLASLDPFAIAIDRHTSVAELLSGSEPDIRAAWTEALTFGEKYTNDPDATRDHIEFGRLIHNAMLAESTKPAYSRKSAVEKAKALFVAANINPKYPVNEVISSYWVARIACSAVSEPDATGMSTRSFRPIAEEFYGGNISPTALRHMAKLIARASKDDKAMDSWDIRKGCESFFFESLDRLRRSTLNSAQLLRAIEARKELAQGEMDQDDIDRAERKRNLAKAESLAKSLRKQLAEKCGRTTRQQQTEWMRSEGFIEKQMTPDQIAEVMTRGDAIAIVQALLKRASGDKSRDEVFRALAHTVGVENVRRSNGANPAPIPKLATGT